MEGTCKLCQKITVLRKSHIIPNFIAKHIRENEKSLFQTGTDENAKLYNKLTQDLLKEYLLCSECENLFGKYENAVRRIFKDYKTFVDKGDGVSIQLYDTKNDKGHNYDLKYFFLSILFRWSVASFSSDNLGKYEENIRLKLLNEGSFSTWEFPIFLFNIHSSQRLDSHGIDLTKIVEYPRIIRKFDCVFQNFTLYGLSILILISQNVLNVPKELPLPSVAMEDNYFTLYNIEEFKLNFLNGIKNTYFPAKNIVPIKRK